jgi:hypothetical protein
MAVAYLGGPQAWAQQTKYSDNPFLNAIQDLMPLINLFTNYMQYKPYIDQYSNTSLSDIAPIVKQYLPDVVTKDGKIDYKKLQKYLTDTKDPMKQQIASQVFDIARTRYQFANAPFQQQMLALQNPTLATILNGQQILAKTITNMSKINEFNQKIDNSSLPDYMKTLLKQTAPKLFDNPALVALIMPYLSGMQNSNSQPTNSILQPLDTTAPSGKSSSKDSSGKNVDTLELDTYNYLGA